MKNFANGWYLLYTRPRHERKLADHLSFLKLDYFLPTVKTLRTWHDRKKLIEMPLFPSYVFVNLKDMQGYYDALHADGALYYVKYGKEVARVNESVISNIQLVVAGGQDIEVSTDYFRAGQKLVISEGALTGLNCEMIEYKGTMKILVRVNLVHRSILVTVPSESLISAAV
jgi:transcriptional antiterminator RfaH